MSKTNIILAADIHYIDYLEITLKSLLAHNENLCVFILHTGDITQEWAEQRKPYFEKRYSELNLVYIKNTNSKNLQSNGYITTTTYLRLYIEYLFQYSLSPYWIYLDCDTVINGDIVKPFKQLNFARYAIAAVSDPYVNGLLTHPFLNTDYFNSGVIYFNANQWKSGTSEHLIYLAEHLKDKLIFSDQDVLNYHFQDNWLQLEHHYNFQLEHLLRLENHNDIISATIFHFTGPYKPLGEIRYNETKINKVISLFRLYHSLNWSDIVTLPKSTIQLVL